MPISSFVSSFGWGRRASAYPSDTDFDPYFQYVTLLLHLDGANGSTTFTDNSINTKVVTPFGGAQISTSDFKFGGASAFFNNTNAYLTTPNHPDFNFNTNDWTVELYCNLNPIESDILINKAITFGFFPFQIRVNGGRFNARGYSSSGVIAYNLGAGIGPIVSTNTWYHVAACRQSSNFYLYVDGNLIDYAVNTGTLFSSASPISIAGLSNGQGLASGYFDDIRITNGICRYPNGTPFIVRTTAFPNS